MMMILMFCIQERLKTLRAGLFGVQKPASTGEFSLQKFSNRLRGLRAFYSSDTGALFPGLSSRSVRQATHHHLEPRLWTNGSIPPFLLYTFMTCVETSVNDILLTTCNERH